LIGFFLSDVLTVEQNRLIEKCTVCLCHVMPTEHSSTHAVKATAFHAILFLNGPAARRPFSRSVSQLVMRKFVTAEYLLNRNWLLWIVFFSYTVLWILNYSVLILISWRSLRHSGLLCMLC